MELQVMWSQQPLSVSVSFIIGSTRLENPHTLLAACLCLESEGNGGILGQRKSPRDTDNLSRIEH
jgi:hypothetical protein